MVACQYHACLIQPLGWKGIFSELLFNIKTGHTLGSYILIFIRFSVLAQTILDDVTSFTALSIVCGADNATNATNFDCGIIFRRILYSSVGNILSISRFRSCVANKSCLGFLYEWMSSSLFFFLHIWPSAFSIYCFISSIA